MSTRTIKQRIAVVAVSALTAGVISVIPTTTASAAPNEAIGAANAATAANVMNVAGNQADPAVRSLTIADNRSNGLIRLGTAVNTTGTAVMLSTGKMAVYLTGVIRGGSTIVITNGTTTDAASIATATAAKVLNAAGTRVAIADGAAASVLAALITPDTGATTMTISYYEKANLVAAAADGAAETAGATTSTTAAIADLGTLNTTYTVRVLTPSSFLSLTGTYCQVYEGSSVTDLSVVTQLGSTSSMVVPLGSTFTVTSTTAADQVIVSAPGLITAATNTIVSTGLEVPLTTADTSSATIRATALGSYTLKLHASGAPSTITDTISVTVVATCTTSAVSLGDSLIELQAANGDAPVATAGVATAANSVDDTNAVFNGKKIYLAGIYNNGYGQALPVGTWTAEVSDGAVVAVASATAAQSCGNTKVAATSATGATIKVTVCQATDNVPWAGTIKLSYNGTLLVTKTAAIFGQLASIAVTNVKIAKTGGVVHYTAFTTNARDAAGNRVVTTLGADSATLNQVVTNVIAANTSALADTTNGNGVACGATAGSADVVLQATNASGATIKSAPFKVFCAGTTATYTASMDKAVYNPGDIATVTVTAKDSGGNLVHSLLYTGTDGTTGPVGNYVNPAAAPAITGSNLDAVVATATTDVYSAGIKTYQFKVGANEGKYQLAVNLPNVTTDTAKTVAYEIKASTTTVSNADVLKSIVALIASINKQIQALQKLILKR